MNNRTINLICCTPFTDTNWQWLRSFFPEDYLQWYFFYSVPNGYLEKMLKKPNLVMIRTCQQAVKAVIDKNADFLFSHDPRVSFWCSVFVSLFGVNVDHIAYAFNFPNLPQGIKYFLMKLAFKRINKFIVYSNYEKELYNQYFEIPLDKIYVHFWSVGKPKYQPEEPIELGNYICAIGGNARDYSTLVKAMKKLPDIKLVLIARPENLQNIEIPSNVKTFCNIPKSKAMNILKHSLFMVLPLKDSQVPCGHVTLVAAMHLGKAFIITNSIGVQDYVRNEYNCLTCPDSDVDKLSELILHLWTDKEECLRLGNNGKSFAMENCSEESAYQSLRQIIFPDN